LELEIVIANTLLEILKVSHPLYEHINIDDLLTPAQERALATLSQALIDRAEIIDDSDTEKLEQINADNVARVGDAEESLEERLISKNIANRYFLYIPLSVVTTRLSL